MCSSIVKRVYPFDLPANLRVSFQSRRAFSEQLSWIQPLKPVVFGSELAPSRREHTDAKVQLSPLLCEHYTKQQTATRLWEIAGRGYDPTHSVLVSDPLKISHFRHLVLSRKAKGTTGVMVGDSNLRVDLSRAYCLQTTFGLSTASLRQSAYCWACLALSSALSAGGAGAGGGASAAFTSAVMST